jgi:hypothetical protein
MSGCFVEKAGACHVMLMVYDWTRFEAARRALAQKFGNSVPAPRYRAVGLARQIA